MNVDAKMVIKTIKSLDIRRTKSPTELMAATLKALLNSIFKPLKALGQKLLPYIAVENIQV